ncbi:MAG: hypothetical protein ACXABY_20320 [Candidatus Thorarchaeota archaeon]|jgi:hypothetical protein
MTVRDMIQDFITNRLGEFESRYRIMHHSSENSMEVYKARSLEQRGEDAIITILYEALIQAEERISVLEKALKEK